MSTETPTATTTISYSDPRLDLVINDWPFGRELKTRAHFWIEKNKRGERCGRALIDPRTQRQCAKKYTTYQAAARIVTGSDGRTYIIGKGPYSTGIQIMQGDMKFIKEYVYADDADPARRAFFETLDALFRAEVSGPPASHPVQH